MNILLVHPPTKLAAQPQMPLRILYLYNRNPRYVRNLVLRQALRRSHDVVELASAWTNPLRSSLSIAWRAPAGARQPFDLVVIGFHGHLLVPWLRLWTRVPILFDPFVSVYDTFALDRRLFGPRSLLGRLSYALDLWSCRQADYLLFDTQAHRDYFVQTFGLPPAKTSVVYVGCDESHFAPRPAPPPTGAFEVYTYTSFLRLHGVEHILHAARLLASRDDVRFTIAGAGGRLDEMQRLARELDLPNVRFPGWVDFDQLPEQIAQADLCLGGHFSDVPKAGRVIATKTFQFLAMGRPTVVGDNPASREVLLHGQNAYLCPMADPAALAAAILELRDDGGLRHRIAAGGLALYRRRFTVEATARDLQAVLDDLLA
jgi:glycosyltransferase involved in cell wall biosynthesis